MAFSQSAFHENINTMKNFIIFFATIFSTFTSQVLVTAQVYSWERVSEAVITDDTVCYAYNGGFSFAGGFGDKFPKPTLFDLDGDGDLDFFVGSYTGNSGRIMYVENTGSVHNPCWVIRSENFADITVTTGVPSPYFVDINGDSLPDLITGDEDGGGNGGTVYYFKNISSGNDFKFILEEDTLAGLDAYDYSDPCSGDVDADGDMDLVVGGGLGDVYFCRNKGNNQWALPLKIYSEFGTADDKASPELGDLNNDGIPELLVGRANTNRIELYHIAYFNEDTVAWELLDDNYITQPNLGFTVYSSYVTPILAQFDGDSLVDLLLVGKLSEEFIYFKNIGTSDSAVWDVATFPFKFVFPTFLNASIEDLDNNGKQEFIFLHSNNNFITIYENEGGSASPNWSLDATMVVDSIFDSPFSLNMVNFEFIDINGDSLIDILTKNNFNPIITVFINKSTSGSYKFEYYQDVFLENLFSTASQVGFVVTGDIEDDGNTDLFLYNYSLQQVVNYEWNNFSQWILKTNNFPIQPVKTVDFDGDGKTDIIAGSSSFLFYKNIGTQSSPIYQLQNPWTDFGPLDIEGGNLDFVDLDGNCGKDIFTSHSNGGVLVWGFRGIKPTITQPFNTNFEICDTTTITLNANPLGGIWEGYANSNGAFVPSDFPETGDYWIIYSYTDPGGCYTKKDSLLISINECIVSTNGTSTVNVFSVSPNPAEDGLSISYYVGEETTPVCIYLGDIMGIKKMALFNGFAFGENTVFWPRPTEFSPGIYLITLSTDTQCLSKKVIIK